MHLNFKIHYKFFPSVCNRKASHVETLTELKSADNKQRSFLSSDANSAVFILLNSWDITLLNSLDIIWPFSLYAFLSLSRLLVTVLPISSTGPSLHLPLGIADSPHPSSLLFLIPQSKVTFHQHHHFSRTFHQWYSMCFLFEFI